MILAMSERIRALAESKVRYASAGFDLPNRRMELQILDNTVASCLAALGRSSEPDPAALLLPAATVGVVRAMVEQRSGIATAMRAARDEAAAALDALQTRKAAGWRGKSGARTCPGKAWRGFVESPGERAPGRDPGGSRSAGCRNNSVAGVARALKTMVRRYRGARRRPGSALPGRLAPGKRRRQTLPRSVPSFPNALPNTRAIMPCSRPGWTPFGPRSMSPTMKRRPTIRRARDEAWATHRAALTAIPLTISPWLLARDDSAGAGRLAKASRSCRYPRHDARLGRGRGRPDRAFASNACRPTRTSTRNCWKSARRQEICWATPSINRPHD